MTALPRERFRLVFAHDGHTRDLPLADDPDTAGVLYRDVLEAARADGAQVVKCPGLRETHKITRADGAVLLAFVLDMHQEVAHV